MSRARANSCERRRRPRIHEPTTSSDTTGSSAVIEVFSDRISTWFSDRFTMSL